MTNLPHTKNLELDISKDWLTIWLNRPNSRNALTNEMILFATIILYGEFLFVVKEEYFVQVLT